MLYSQCFRTDLDYTTVAFIAIITHLNRKKLHILYNHLNKIMMTTYLTKQNTRLPMKMMFALLLFAFSFMANAQCPSGNITFNTNQEITFFLLEYPNCTEINGNLRFAYSGTDTITEIGDLPFTSIAGDLEVYSTRLVNLKGLEDLTHIGGTIFIYNNTELVSLKGLENITTVEGDLKIQGNSVLKSVLGLNSINSVNGAVRIFENPLLLHLNDLNSLTNIGSVGGQTNNQDGELFLLENPALLSIAGLSSLNNIKGNLFIQKNGLQNLSGLDNLTIITGDVRILQNNNLGSISSLNTITDIGGELLINNNAISELNGFQNLASIGGPLTIGANGSGLNKVDKLANLSSINGALTISYGWLTDLSGLVNIDPTTISNLVIVFNQNLSVCNIQNFCAYLSIPTNPRTIEGNTGDCVSDTAVTEICSLYGNCDDYTIWNGTSWSNGLPDATKRLILNGNLDVNTNTTVCEVLIKSGVLTVASGTSLIVEKQIINTLAAENFILENNSNLVQIENFENQGAITYNRLTAPMNKKDYTYWGSPVKGQISSQLFANPNNIFKWNVGSQSWLNASGQVMDVGYGYIMRAPTNFPGTGQAKQTLAASFKGVPNNNDISVEVTADPDALTSDPYSNAVMSFLSNPYPSAINIDKFFTDPDNAPKITPTIYLWTHSTNPTPNTEGTLLHYAADDFAVYNSLGGIGTEAFANDTASRIPTGEIASGQGFFIKGSVTGGTVTFKNTYRINEGQAYDNSHFYRMAQTNLNKHRVWLSIQGNNTYKQTLVGYIDGASDELDVYDSEVYEGGNPVSIYSLLDTGKQLAIQGRAMPFDDIDEVQLGYKTTAAGDYAIHLDRFDGLFSTEGQDIFLKDELMGSYHNLKDDAYTFYTDAGSFEDRFSLVYKDALSISNPIENGNWKVFSKDGSIEVVAHGFEIKDISVYDMLGRKVSHAKNIFANSHSLEAIQANQLLIVKVTTVDNQQLTKKISN